MESSAVLKSHGLPEALPGEKCLAERKGWSGLTAADLSSSQSCGFPQQEHSRGREDLRLEELSLPARALPKILHLPGWDLRLRSGGAGLSSKLIRGAVCEGGCLLDALILLGAGISLEATQLLSLFAATAT